jgi:hypothetical protein
LTSGLRILFVVRALARRVAGWLRVTTAASSFPGGALSHAEALTTEDAFTWNRSTSQTRFYFLTVYYAQLFDR